MLFRNKERDDPNWWGNSRLEDYEHMKVINFSKNSSVSKARHQTRGVCEYLLETKHNLSLFSIPNAISGRIWIIILWEPREHSNMRCLKFTVLEKQSTLNVNVQQNSGDVQTYEIVS